MAFQRYDKMTSRHTAKNSVPQATICRASRDGHRRLRFSTSATELLTCRHAQLFADIDAGKIAIKWAEEKSKTTWSVMPTAPGQTQLCIPKNFPFEVGDRFRVCPSDIEGFDLILTKIEETDKT